MSMNESEQKFFSRGAMVVAAVAIAASVGGHWLPGYQLDSTAEAAVNGLIPTHQDHLSFLFLYLIDSINRSQAGHFAS